MKLELKYKNTIEKRLSKVNLGLSLIALIGFFFEISFSDFLNIMTSKQIWITLPKTFLILMPILEMIFVSFSGERDAIRKFWKLFPFTILFLLVLEFGVKGLFEISLFHIVIIGWWINSLSYKIILLTILICLALGFIKLKTSNATLNLYFASNEISYAIGGLIYLRNNGASTTFMGTPALSIKRDRKKQVVNKV